MNPTATAVSPVDIAAALTELWSPRVVGAFDDNYVKVAKVQGTFGWHCHPDEDELFHILRGRLRIEELVHLGVDTGDEEARDRCDAVDGLICPDAPLEPSQMCLDHLAVSRLGDEQRHVDVDPVGETALDGR